MSFEIKLAVQGRLSDFMKEEYEAGRRAVTDGVRATVESGKQFARAQLVSAGLGARLANSWQGQAYPTRAGAASLRAAGLVYSKAPDIVHGYGTGGTIVPVNGRKYLAIPTSYALMRVPALRGNRRVAQRVTPQRLADYLGVKLVLRRNRHGTLWLEGQGLRLSKGKRSRGIAKRASARALAKGKGESFPLFWLVKSVSIRKRLDLPAIERHIESEIEPNILRKWQELVPNG